MENSANYVRSKHADVSTVGDRVVLYHRPSGKAIVLNPTGSLLWNSLETPKSREALAGVLKARYANLEDGRALADVDEFLKNLKTHDLVETP